MIISVRLHRHAATVLIIHFYSQREYYTHARHPRSHTNYRDVIDDLVTLMTTLLRTDEDSARFRANRASGRKKKKNRNNGL